MDLVVEWVQLKNQIISNSYSCRKSFNDRNNFFALNSIQRDAGMNDTRYARDLGLLLSGNVTELVANNQKKEISNVAEKFWRSSRNLRYIFLLMLRILFNLVYQLVLPLQVLIVSSN